MFCDFFLPNQQSIYFLASARLTKLHRSYSRQPPDETCMAVYTDQLTGHASKVDRFMFNAIS